MTKVALLGAGGKMGLRLASNLKTSRFSVDHIEISEAGRARLKQEVGVDAVPGDNAVADADVVLLAVPDRAIGAVAGGLIDRSCSEKQSFAVVRSRERLRRCAQAGVSGVGRNVPTRRLLRGSKSNGAPVSAR